MKTSPLTSASAGAATLVMISLAIVLAATPAHTQARPRSDGVPSATLTEHTVTVSGVERRYLMAVPSRLDPRTAVPLVLVFHGFGGSAGQVAAELGFRELAGRERFVAVFPDGIDRRWRDGYAVDERADVDDHAFVRALLADVARQVAVDSRRIYAAGHSNGAFFVQSLACRMPGTFAAIGPVAGQLTTAAAASCATSAPVSMLEIHGTADGVVPFDGGRLRPGVDLLSVESSAAFRARRAGCAEVPRVHREPDRDQRDGTTVRRIVYDGCADGRAVELWVVDGGSHRWPGSDGRRGPRRTARTGTPSQEIDGATLLWTFFRGHPAP